ncbi:DUF6240 domain-containing protein [Lachnospiraceae bacterium 45-W7]
MRVDNSNLAEITNSTNRVEVKGNVSVLTEEETVRKTEQDTGRVVSVQQTTVDKPFFSGDSQLEQIRQEAEQMEAQLLQDKMQVVSNTVTAADCGKMEEEGYSVSGSDVDTIITVTDKIKMELAKAGVDISVFGDTPDAGKLEQMAGSEGEARRLEAAIEKADLPATDENLADCQDAMQQAADLTTCSEEAVKYMLDNDLAPTVENLYKAQHSTGESPNRPSAGIEMDEGMKAQVSQVITQAGRQVNDTTLSCSQWMIEQQIPLTAENLNYVLDLKNAVFPPAQDQVVSAMAEAMAEGRRPQDAVILDGYRNTERARQAAETIEQTTDADIWTVVKKGAPLTIESLREAQNSAKELSGNGRQGADVKDSEILEYAKEDRSFLKAKRQLEEIRLIMTAQANYSLLRQGISIETQPLQELVEQLKAQENAYYASLLSQNNIEPTQENTDIFADTMAKTQELQGVPAYVLGEVHTNEDSVNEVHEKGIARQAQMERAGEAYETLRTEPRADLGDSIQKAFQNVDDILNDLDLETSEANRRAVRILAYNQMAVNPESVMEMKAADQKVQNLFQNLTPSVVMEMIREGVNPLELNVEELNAKAQEMKNKLDAGGEEKFSKYLWKLEQRHELTQEERDSYIGIYRMLNQIDKTDGAVIGALVQQGAELSMKNLLSAVRTNRNPGINVFVDDSFGEAETVNAQELSISQQIEAAYQTDCAKEALKFATPEGMQQAQGQKSVEDMTPEELLWQLRQAEKDTKSEEAYYEHEMEEFSQAKKAEAQILQMLAGHDMPVTAYNILAAGRMLHPRGGIFKSLFEPLRQEEDTDIDLEQVKQDILEQFGEAVKTPEEMAKAHKKLAETAENVMKTMADSETVTSRDLRDIKILRQQIALGTRLAKEEHYAIPVLVADELTNVQLKIVRGKEEKGRVDVLFETPKLGKVAARFQVMGDAVKGYAVSDSQRTIQGLKSQEDSLKEQLSSADKLWNMDFVHSESLDLNRFTDTSASDADDLNVKSDSYQVQTKTLYGIARGFLEEIKKMGQNLS